MLRMLRSQGMSTNHLNTVFVALVISRLLYALPTWGMFVSAGQRGKIDAFLRLPTNMGFCKEIVTFNDLLTNSAETVFSKVQASNHCLHSLLPEKRSLYSQK